MAIKKLLINGGVWQFALEWRSDGTAAVLASRPDGSAHSLTVSDVCHDPKTSTIRFVLNGRCHSMRVAGDMVQAADGNALTVTPVAHRHLQSLFTPAVAHAENATPSLHDPKTVKSPLAGRVTKVLVAEGSAVEQGQPLLLIESMKMENELCASAAGCVKTIFIAAGDVVKPNQVLLSLA